MKKILLIGLGVVVLVGTSMALHGSSNNSPNESLDPTPQNATLSGTYVCLPLIDTSAPPTAECVFGLKADDGVYYMVNFGQSALAKEQFDKRAHITADGFVVIKEALNTDQWVKYNMKGIFTITKPPRVSNLTQ